MLNRQDVNRPACVSRYLDHSEAQEVPLAHFGGKVYQFQVLSFGLVLAPLTVAKYTDTAMAPLWLQGVRTIGLY